MSMLKEGATTTILESLGFFLPAIYIPSYARSLGISPLFSTIILALLNSSSVIGAISLGHLCDRMHVTTVILLWGLASSFPVLVLCAAVYGLFAGGFSSIWTGMYRCVQSRNPHAKMRTLMGLFSAGRGIGAVMSGPVSELLLAYGGLEWGGEKIGFASRYGSLIFIRVLVRSMDWFVLGLGRGNREVLDKCVGAIFLGRKRYVNRILRCGRSSLACTKENIQTRSLTI